MFFRPLAESLDPATPAVYDRGMQFVPPDAPRPGGRFLANLIPMVSPERYDPAGDRSAAAAKSAHLRNQLPTHTYLYLLHQAAVTGQLPVLDSRNRVVGQMPIDSTDRMRLLAGLVNKTMPDAKTVALPTPPPPPAQDTPLATLTDEQLAAMAEGRDPSDLSEDDVEVVIEPLDPDEDPDEDPAWEA